MGWARGMLAGGWGMGVGKHECCQLIVVPISSDRVCDAAIAKRVVVCVAAPPHENIHRRIP